ncbi:hypothetical protein LX99_03803 [Mucilaginibacter oryzae]|uniref:Uncharacterized protein n=1 Tax=Mucilaginibacter oryzae TaxID=468058 RepID=A0A316H5K5_9SPHI|nr:hypothetical protein [Mucilaginibacter oryzae]PWK75310.1 hypothetical protein LX99_03803 [Mucilaginibacter oryzae]
MNQALEQPTQYNFRIYSYTSIGIATFLGGPVATAYMLSKNFKAFNRPKAVLVTWLVAVIIEIGIIIAFEAIPFVTNLWFLIPVIDTIIALLLTKVFQGEQMAAYNAGGGDAFAWEKGLGIGLLILAITVAVLFVSIIVLLSSMGFQC